MGNVWDYRTLAEDKQLCEYVCCGHVEGDSVEDMAWAELAYQ